MAPETPPPMRWDVMNMAEMREFLGAFGLPTNGSRGELIARLSASTVAEHHRQAARAGARPTRGPRRSRRSRCTSRWPAPRPSRWRSPWRGRS